MRRGIGLLIVSGVLLALVPVSASAQGMSNEDVIAAQKAGAMAAKSEANQMNDWVRCRQKIANIPGLAVPGSLTASTPLMTPFDTADVVNACGPMPQTVASTTTVMSPPSGTCVSAMRSLTQAENDIVNNYEIMNNKSLNSGGGSLPMPADVAALIGC